MIELNNILIEFIRNEPENTEEYKFILKLYNETRDEYYRNKYERN